jgi:exodeoxyribonuclease VII large subunit
MRRGIESRMQNTDLLAGRLVHPGERIDNQLAHLQRLRERLAGSWQRNAEIRYWCLRDLDRRIAVIRPDISRLIERQQELGLRLNRAGASRIEMLITGLRRQQANLEHLHPASVLERGYSIAYTADGTILRDSSQIDVGDVIRMKFAKGWSKANVSEKGE